ncbi:hypothetical protein C0992_007154 [Termitomyces sp. T32_za158]|nr:hypothetical protein C0992_007154 [Termitomyces sp. T32_za158]
MIGSKSTSLAEFAYSLALKYKQGGPGEKLDNIFVIHTALLCNFTLNNPDLIGEEEPKGEGSVGIDDASQCPQKKKRKSLGGRLARGEDYWSKVEAYFEKEIATRGWNLAGHGWKDIVDEIVRLENWPQQISTPSSTARSITPIVANTHAHLVSPVSPVSVPTSLEGLSFERLFN